MDYSHDRDRSLACLRAAVALMGKHAAVLDPISFAVWYDYAAGGSLELKSKLDALIAQGGLVSQNLMRELFLKYVVHPESDPALEVLNQVLGLTQAVSKSTAMAREANAELGRSLSTFENRLSDPPGPQTLGNAVDDMRQASAQTQESIQQVSAMLAQHSGEIERLRGELQQAKEEASLDGLTQVLNRRAFDRAVAESLNQEMPTSGHHPCLLLLDVDNFKLLNDGFGHAFGDEVLRALARVLRSVTAAGDSVGRFGGDEFALLLCVHTLDEARAVAESLRQQVAKSRVRVGQTGEQRGQVTISLGAAARVAGEDAGGWLQRADAALYRAKHDGRNRVAWA
jgi:diguanylate cyclase